MVKITCLKSWETVIWFIFLRMRPNWNTIWDYPTFKWNFFTTQSIFVYLMNFQHMIIELWNCWDMSTTILAGQLVSYSMLDQMCIERFLKHKLSRVVYLSSSVCVVGCRVTWFISRWKRNSCLLRSINSQNDNYFYSKWP